MRAFVVACICIAALASAQSARAAQRYAAPAGSGETCSQQAPCSFETAVEKAGANDEVIVTAGAYTLTKEVFGFAEGLSIHGDPAGPMPTISAKINFYAIQVSGQGSVISYLDLTDTAEQGNPLWCIGMGSRVERVRVTGVGKDALGLHQSGGCVVRDSVILASGEGATALLIAGMNETTSVARNVTAIAQGPDSVGISSFNESIFVTPGVHTVDLKNAIAEGQKADLLAKPGFEYPSEVLVSHSNFDQVASEDSSKIVDVGGNQTAPPLFANASAGDYREAAGSPTIDAGIADQLGALDLAGNPRVLGPAPDIGAYETAGPPLPPPVTAELRSLVLSPTAFRASNLGGAIASRAKKRPAPVGSKVTYALSAAGTVSFTVERKLVGRQVGRKCVPKTRANATKKKCALFKPVKGPFSAAGTSGLNRFTFSGRVGNKSLKPGPYRLVGSAGGAVKRVSFRIVK
jgi:hypothetical protein